MLAGALVVSWTQRRPTREMGRRGKHAHVHADLGNDHLGGTSIDARNTIQSAQLVGKRGEPTLDLHAERADRFLKVVEMAQKLADEKGVMRPKPAGQRRPQR